MVAAAAAIVVDVLIFHTQCFSYFYLLFVCLLAFPLWWCIKVFLCRWELWIPVFCQIGLINLRCILYGTVYIWCLSCCDGLTSTLWICRLKVCWWCCTHWWSISQFLICLSWSGSIISGRLCQSILYGFGITKKNYCSNWKNIYIKIGCTLIGADPVGWMYAALL